MAELHPALKPQEADKILSSIQEWMIKQTANPTNPAQETDKSEFRKETSLSPSVAVVEPPMEPAGSVAPGRSLGPSQEGKSSPAAINLFAGVELVVGVLLIAVVGGVVWYTYGDNQARNPIRASVYWLTSSFGATKREPKESAQSDQTQTLTATSTQAKEVAELKQQVSALMNDLAVMRRDVEQLSGKQDQMSRDIATVQATEQNVGEKISSLTQPAPVLTQQAPPIARPAVPMHGQARKSIPRVVHPETTKQPDTASVPATTLSTGTVALTEQPPRPPLPVPTVTETPAPLH
jgi:uncharacterized protein YoxC